MTTPPRTLYLHDSLAVAAGTQTAICVPSPRSPSGWISLSSFANPTDAHTWARVAAIVTGYPSRIRRHPHGYDVSIPCAAPRG